MTELKTDGLTEGQYNDLDDLEEETPEEPATTPFTVGLNAYVEITVALGDNEAVVFRRSYSGETDPLELLDNLVDSVKSYLETV